MSLSIDFILLQALKVSNILCVLPLCHCVADEVMSNEGFARQFFAVIHLDHIS